VYNEANSIEPVLRKVAAAPVDKEILVVEERAREAAGV